MFRSLHMKLVLILILMIISVMVVMGTFLINSVGNYYLRDFYDKVTGLFDYNMRVSLEQAAQGENGAKHLEEMVAAHTSSLGISNHRSYYILDENGAYLAGPRPPSGALSTTPNMLAAMAGEVGITNAAIDSYMDAAYPIDGGTQDYIIYICDDKKEIQELTWRFFSIVLETMVFGLLVSVLLSFLLSKTITTPIEHIKKQAQLVATGDFSHRLPIQSGDEIGSLTETFNDMAAMLQSTLGEVQEERDKLSTLFLHMTDGVAAFSTDGHIIHMNPATERLMGVTFDESMTFNQVFNGLEMPASANERKVVSSEIIRRGRTLNVLLAPYGAADDERGVIAVIHDITEQRKLDDARREFVANVSHELRTPLTNIKSYTETLMDAAGELPADTEKRFLGVISGEADRMTRIVKDLLTLSKLDYGRMDLAFRRFSMKEMLETIYTAMKLDAENNGHQLTLEFQGDIPDITGDKERLEQVVVNIISNAIKYTPAGGHIHVTAALQMPKSILLRIQDDGMGIPAEDVPRLFERFYRVDKARSRQKGGTGLGLAIAKEMVEAHHGTIHLESELGKGTTVTIILPTDLKEAGNG